MYTAHREPPRRDALGHGPAQREGTPQIHSEATKCPLPGPARKQPDRLPNAPGSNPSGSFPVAAPLPGLRSAGWGPGGDAGAQGASQHRTGCVPADLWEGPRSIDRQMDRWTVGSASVSPRGGSLGQGRGGTRAPRAPGRRGQLGVSFPCPSPERTPRLAMLSEEPRLVRPHSDPPPDSGRGGRAAPMREGLQGGRGQVRARPLHGSGPPPLVRRDIPARLQLPTVGTKGPTTLLAHPSCTSRAPGPCRPHPPPALSSGNRLSLHAREPISDKTAESLPTRPHGAAVVLSLHTAPTPSGAPARRQVPSAGALARNRRPRQGRAVALGSHVRVLAAVRSPGAHSLVPSRFHTPASVVSFLGPSETPADLRCAETLKLQRQLRRQAPGGAGEPWPSAGQRALGHMKG